MKKSRLYLSVFFPVVPILFPYEKKPVSKCWKYMSYMESTQISDLTETKIMRVSVGVMFNHIIYYAKILHFEILYDHKLGYILSIVDKTIS